MYAFANSLGCKKLVVQLREYLVKGGGRLGGKTYKRRATH